MTKLLDYLKWRGDLPLEYDGFNELDAAVLARLSYVPLEQAPETVRRQGVDITELTAYITAVPGIEDAVLMPQDLALCRQVSESRRYKGIGVYDYVSHWDEASETQFAAVTFELSESFCCIAFRGTDNTLIGWKEDLNMGVTFPVPAQASAAEYLNTAAKRFPDRAFILCGHSKGGNLAVYAGAFCNSAFQNRVSIIYNFDGPGFESQALDSLGYKAVSGRLLTLVPQFSVVGMLFDNDRPYTVVKSEANGIMQHDLYSWQVEGRHFVYARELSQWSRKLDSTLGVWMRQMGPEERESTVEAIYQILTQNKAQTIDDLYGKGLENAMATLKTIRRLDETTRANVLRAIQLLMTSLKSEALVLNEAEGNGKAV